MNFPECQYAPLTQPEVTTFHEDENGSNHLNVSASGTSPTELETEVLDADGRATHSYNYKRPRCWGRVPCRRLSRTFTNREIVLCLVIICLLFALVMVLAFRGNEPVPSCSLEVTDDTPCVTRSCVEVSSRISLSMDETTDPCDDFYQFSCGGWVKRNPLPPGHARWGTFNELWQRNQAFLKSILESNSTKSTSSGNISTSEEKAKLYYKSCLNMDGINKLGPKPLVDLIQEFGGWGIWSTWNESTFNFNDTLLKLAPFSIFPFFSINVGTDSKHSNTNVIMVGESGLGLGSRDHYINKTVEDDKILGAYALYMTEIGVLLGGETNHTRQQMLEIIDLEREIAEITLPLEELRNEEKNYHKFNFSELQTMADAVDWVPLFDKMFGEIANLTISANESIITSSLDYVKKFSSIVRKTPKRVLSNYAIWRVTQLFISVMSQPFIDAEYKLHKTKYGADLSCWERWLDCVGTVDISLGMALGRLFIEKHFDASSKQSAANMVHDIKAAFNRTLARIKWMDAATKVKASVKAQAVEDMIGFPDEILNTTYVDEQYHDLDFRPGQSYFEQRLNLIKFITKDELTSLREPVDRKEWAMTPPTVNAYYSPNKNVIVFPAGILQPPFYSNLYPQSVNFGGIGIVVGHELTHGFDDQGRQYDKDGNLRNWWQESTSLNFNKNAKCMVDQYSQYTIAGKNLNGNLTIGENIADNGGLRLAFESYSEWRRTNSSWSESDPLLPSLNYTRDQLFFIAFAQLWCTTSTPESDQQSILTNVHSPGKYRVIGTVSNSPEFTQAFNCPRGSPMNPTDKCRVW